MKKTYTLTILLTIILFLSYSSVDNSLTKDDYQYIPLYLKGISSLPKKPTYQNELDFISLVQHSVQNIAYKNVPIPFGQLREPKQLYNGKTGLCFDKSRVIEKILRYSHFKTRHIAFYSTKETHSKLKSLLTPNIPSHAITEVLTKKGWLVVDSNVAWISLDKNHQPISMQMIQRSVEQNDTIEWLDKPPLRIYAEPFTFMYGLYSRHGKFYPPYNFIPDINYLEFIDNFINTNNNFD